MKRPHTVWITLTLIVGAVMLVAALAACGLDDNNNPTPTGPAAQVTSDITPTVRQITPQPTPLPTRANFGPITGNDYTPEALHTALPPSVSERPCRVEIIAEDVTLHGSPDANTPSVATAYAREKLVVDQIISGDDGNQWVHTAPGWLALDQGDSTAAALIEMRACEILKGTTPDTMLFGLHVLNERSTEEVLDFVRQMKSAGHAVGTVKGLNGTQALLNTIEEISPETVTIFRSLITSDGYGDCPDDIEDLPDPAGTAARWYGGFDSLWDAVDADYFEYMNECPATLEWISDFSIEMMKLANADQRCLLLFSFPGGNPNMDVFNDLLPALEFAAENECAPGRTHGIAMHAYSTEDSVLASESDVWISMRHRIVQERLQMVLPEAADLPIYITEFGIGGGTIMPPCESILRDSLQFTYQIEEDPYVKGFNLWNVGSGAQWYDVTPCLPDIADALNAYYD